MIYSYILNMKFKERYSKIYRVMIFKEKQDNKKMH